MAGTFARLQPIYAEHRVATYPLTREKMPAVRGYQRVGADGSSQLALKFATADAFGFCAGRRNRLTIVDIDSTDDRIVNEIEDRFGSTPFQVVTPSGGRHLYYRHNGEARRIRPLPDVDILGAGNVVAAGSVVAKGRYWIERGSLDDLDRLPPLRREERQPKERVPEGRRNLSLFGYCRSAVGHCDNLEQLFDAASTWADGRLAAPLPEAEIRKTCASVWRYRGGQRRIMNHIVGGPDFDALAANPQTLALFAVLSAENGQGADFWIADGLGARHGWPRRLVPDARKALVEMGIVVRVRAPHKGSPGLYRWGAGVSPWASRAERPGREER